MASKPMNQAAAHGKAGNPAGKSRWRDLAPRIFSAMVLAPLGLFSIWQGGLVWAAALTLVTTIAVVECVAMARVKLDSRLALIAIAAIPAAQALYLATGQYLAPLCAIAACAIGLVRANRMLAFCLLYVGIGYAALLLLRDTRTGLEDVLFVMLVVWANDIGAYLAGRLIGGKRMAPKLSPGKTWSGALGGLLCALLAGLGIAAALHASPAHQYWAEGIAVPLAIAAQAGDLLESGIKRRFGAKDSGTLIPGHGGVLDRIDAVLAAAPLALLLTLAWQGPIF